MVITAESMGVSKLLRESARAAPKFSNSTHYAAHLWLSLSLSCLSIAFLSLLLAVSVSLSLSAVLSLKSHLCICLSLFLYVSLCLFLSLWESLFNVFFDPASKNCSTSHMCSFMILVIRNQNIHCQPVNR